MIWILLSDANQGVYAHQCPECGREFDDLTEEEVLLQRCPSDNCPTNTKELK